MYEQLYATATLGDVNRVLENTELDGVMIDYQWNAVPEWVQCVPNAKVVLLGNDMVRVIFQGTGRLPDMLKFNIITGMPGTGKTNMVNQFMARILNGDRYPYFHIAYCYCPELWAVAGAYPNIISPFVADVHRINGEGDMLAFINEIYDKYHESKDLHVLIVENIDLVCNKSKPNFYAGYKKICDKLERSNITVIFTGQDLDKHTLLCTRREGSWYANGERQVYCTEDMYNSCAANAVDAYFATKE